VVVCPRYSVKQYPDKNGLLYNTATVEAALAAPPKPAGAKRGPKPKPKQEQPAQAGAGLNLRNIIRGIVKEEVALALQEAFR